MASSPTTSQVSEHVVESLGTAAPHLAKLHLRQCALQPGACLALARLAGLRQLALTWTTFEYGEMARFIYRQEAAVRAMGGRAGGGRAAIVVAMQQGSHQQVNDEGLTGRSDVYPQTTAMTVAWVVYIPRRVFLRGFTWSWPGLEALTPQPAWRASPRTTGRTGPRSRSFGAIRGDMTVCMHHAASRQREYIRIAAAPLDALWSEKTRAGM